MLDAVLEQIPPAKTRTSNSIRIVAVADTHLYHKRLVVPPGDIFVHAGDMCGNGPYHELRVAAEWIMSLPHRHKVIIAGNHDWAFVNHAKEARELFKDATYLQDSETTIEGLRFYGAPWQPRFFDWAFNLERGKQLAYVWRKIPLGIDVLITHGPPAGFGDICFDGRRAGCEDLLERVKVVKPRLHLYGHIHDDGGAWITPQTSFVNVTTSECRRAPTVIDYEPEHNRFTFIHVPPNKK